jgi:hypothetical protein
MTAGRVRDYLRDLSVHAVWEALKEILKTYGPLLLPIAGGAIVTWLVARWQYFGMFVLGSLLTLGAAVLYVRRHRTARYAHDAYERTITAAHLVGTQNHTRPPRKAYTHLRLTFLVLEDYSGVVIRQMTLRAIEPLHFFALRFFVDDAAPSVEHLDGIDIRTESSPSGSVTCFLSESSGRKKGLLVYLLPFLEPGQERCVTIMHRWPGMFAALQPPDKANRWNRTTRGRGHEPYEWKISGSRARIPEVEFAFFAHPGLGEPIVEEITGAQAGTVQAGVDCPASLPLWEHATKNWRGFIYTVPDVAPADQRRFGIRLGLRRPRP